MKNFDPPVTIKTAEYRARQAMEWQAMHTPGQPTRP